MLSKLEPSIIISLIAMILTATLAYIGAQRGVTAKLARLESKVEVLQSRVELHNSVIERTAILEERVRWLENEWKQVTNK